MPLPEAAQIAEDFKQRLLVLEQSASQELIDAYTPIWQRLRRDVISLVNEGQDLQLSAERLKRLARYQALMAQVEAEMRAFSTLSQLSISQSQLSAIELSQLGARATVGQALPRGLGFELLANVGIEWNALPTEAFSSFVGMAGDGSPLARILATFGPEAADGITQGILEGIARGLGPREVADLVRTRFGVPLARALTIVRTETLRAYREAARAQYLANSNIVRGYRRLSARDSRVCMACIALDGTLYSLDEPLNEHVGGRCALVPNTITYRDLGLDVDEAPFDFESAQDWFLRQPENVQRSMMGPGKFTAWRDGKFQIPELAKIIPNQTWGEAAVVAPLKELV